MVSISDGMGSGKRANDISGLTTRRIENFYKAGFDSDVIIRTINQLLTMSHEDNFSTIDLCIIDGRLGTYDFIKLASANGYILHDHGDCETIESSNLPIGILENVKPHIVKSLITSMDMVVLMSDGVADALATISIPDYLRGLDIINPQVLCDTIMERAIMETEGIARDDMSVVAIRIFASN